MKIKNIYIKNKIVLAPMAGITNIAFRKIAKEMGAGLVCAEMVSDKGIDYNNKKTLGMLKVKDFEHPISMQIFGSDIDSMVRAAIIVDHSEADIIDINMGCPVNKVVKNNAGAALLKDPDKVYNIVKEVVKNVNKPVTVKIRSGWDNESINAVIIAKLCEKAGASAITIHARTRSQFYSGNADWDIIKKVKESVSIPVIGNGDIKNANDAKRMIDETGCDFVMIGRGAQGNPWIFKEIDEYLTKGIEIKKPSNEEIKNTIIKHTNLLIDIKSEKIAILEMRSHIAWYVKGLRGNAVFKSELNKCKTTKQLFELVENYFSGL